MSDEPPIKSSVMPSRLLAVALVLIAPWLAQCCTVSPIHAPPRPSSAPVSAPGSAA